MRVNKGNILFGLAIFGVIALISTVFVFVIIESEKESEYRDSFIGKEVVSKII